MADVAGAAYQHLLDIEARCPGLFDDETIHAAETVTGHTRAGYRPFEFKHQWKGQEGQDRRGRHTKASRAEQREWWTHNTDPAADSCPRCHGVLGLGRRAEHYVCSDCGFVDPAPVLCRVDESALDQYPAGDLAHRDTTVARSTGSAAYYRPHHFAERVCLWLCRDPPVPPEVMAKMDRVARDSHTRRAPDTEYSEWLWTLGQRDIQQLSRLVGESKKHGERWLQIKSRLVDLASGEGTWQREHAQRGFPYPPARVVDAIRHRFGYLSAAHELLFSNMDYHERVEHVDELAGWLVEQNHADIAQELRAGVVRDTRPPRNIVFLDNILRLLLCLELGVDEGRRYFWSFRCYTTREAVTRNRFRLSLMMYTLASITAGGYTDWRYINGINES